MVNFVKAINPTVNLGYLSTLYVHPVTHHRGLEVAPLAETLSYQEF